MSVRQHTSLARLRQVIAETLTVDALVVRAEIGELRAGTGAHYPDIDEHHSGFYDAASACTVIFADRIPEGMEAAVVKSVIKRWHGDAVAQRLFGEHTVEPEGVPKTIDAEVQSPGLAAEVEAVDVSRAVSMAETKITFSLPDDFGEGWEYDNVVLFGSSHQWGGSYNKTESGNFAHDVLLQLKEIDSSFLCVGLTCNVECKVKTISDAAEIQARLQKVVDAFSVRPTRQISVRGSNFYDSKVTEYDANDPEIEVVSDMPYLNYLAKHVPRAETLPALSGYDLAELCVQADEHQAAKQSYKDDSPSLSF